MADTVRDIPGARRQPTQVDRTGTVRDHNGGGPGARPLVNLPPELEDEWEIESELPTTGGEATLLLVHGRHPDTRGERRVVKIYNAGINLNPEVMRRRIGLNPSHVVQLYRHFRSSEREVELLEYVPGGTLEDIINREGPQLEARLVDAIIRQLCDALAALHGADIVHRDLKPGNILARSREPLDLVLTDFGIASYLDGGSRRETTGSKTQSYAPPEATHLEVSFKTDWWSLGILIVEISTGRHPFASEGSANLISPGQISKRLSNDDVEELVVGVPARWLLLARGLLRREVGNRWGLDKVRRWLDGDDTLTVEPEQAPADPRSRLPVPGATHYTVRDVALALAGHWPQAMESFARGELQNWVERGSDSEAKVAAIREIDQAYRRNTYPLTEAVFRTIVALDEAIMPSCRGYAFDNRGLRRLAEEALRQVEPAEQALQEILERGYLSTYATLRGSQRHRDIEALWHNELDAYVTLSSLVPSEGRDVLSAHLPLAVASGLRAVIGVDNWSSERRDDVRASRIEGRHIPRWYRVLESRISRLPIAALVGIRALASVALREAAEETARRNAARGELVRQSFTVSRIIGIAAIVLLAIFGAFALFRR